VQSLTLSVQEVKTNKKDAAQLYEHATKCAVAIVFRLRGLAEGEMLNQNSSTNDLLK
jgi:hypothetical protein